MPRNTAPYERDDGSLTDIMVGAEVGHGRSPMLPVPERIGEFEHRVIPNDNTTGWSRTWNPTGEGLPELRLTYSITCEHGDWEVTRSVVIRNETQVMGMGDSRGICEDTRDIHTVATADSATQARDLAIDAMLAASALPDHTPPVVNDAAVASFRDIERGGDGTVSEDDIAALVGGEHA